ncbi:MAG: hypothetical protein JSS27_20200 [Planctomycetes bacterium]|nr:hypothetical protein [Planctomycetota bacterium]
MSIGPMGGIVGSLAGSPSAQTRGNEQARAAQDATVQERRAAADARATDAAGIGRTDGEGHETHERDADGRRLWERQEPNNNAEATAEPETPPAPGVKDPAGEAGNELDLSA